MHLTRWFDKIWFSQQAIRSALAVVDGFAEKPGNPGYASYCATIGADEWDLDNPEEFFDLYPKGEHFLISYSVDRRANHGRVGLLILVNEFGTSVKVGSITKAEIVAVMNVFEQNRSTAIVIVAKTSSPPQKQFRVFIGHGRNKQWMDLKLHLEDKHGFKVEAYETGERAGHTIRDILGEMLGRSSIAFLVFTGEDDMADGGVRARQNVVHETGLFQGRLGFSRAVVLLEEGVEGLSNLAGIQYISFPKDGIRSTFGDVLAVIRREIGKEALRRRQ